MNLFGFDPASLGNAFNSAGNAFHSAANNIVSSALQAAGAFDQRVATPVMKTPGLGSFINGVASSVGVQNPYANSLSRQATNNLAQKAPGSNSAYGITGDVHDSIRLGGQIAGTVGGALIGGGVARGLGAIPALSARAPQLAQTLRAAPKLATTPNPLFYGPAAANLARSAGNAMDLGISALTPRLAPPAIRELFPRYVHQPYQPYVPSSSYPQPASLSGRDLGAGAGIANISNGLFANEDLTDSSRYELQAPLAKRLKRRR